MKRTVTILALMFLTFGLFAQNQVVFDIRVDSVTDKEAYFRLISFVPDTAMRQQTYTVLPNVIKNLTEQIKSWKTTRFDYREQLKDPDYSDSFKEGLQKKNIDPLTIEIEKYKLERQFRRAIRDSVKLYKERIK